MAAREGKDDEGNSLWCVRGPSGAKSCAATCFLCVLGWPLSPLIPLYLRDRRQRLNVISQQDDDSTLKTRYCFWCWELLELQGYYQQLETEGTLPYEWDIERYEDHLKTARQEIVTRTILVRSTHTI